MEALDYKELCRGYIPEQYKRSGNLLGVIDCILDQCQELEGAFLELLAMLDPYTAVGPALDFIGALVGVSRRPGEGDDAYRPRVFLRINLAGMPSTEAIRQFIIDTFGLQVVGLYPDYPAGLYVVFDGNPGEVDVQAAEGQITSGTSLTRGTFLRAEGEMDAIWVVSEDTGKAFVIDYVPPPAIPQFKFRARFPADWDIEDWQARACTLYSENGPTFDEYGHPVFDEAFPIEMSVVSQDDEEMVLDITCYGNGVCGYDLDGNWYKSLFDYTDVLEIISSEGTAVLKDTEYMFYNCHILERIGNLDTSGSADFFCMFNGCYSLEELPPLDCRSATNMGLAFAYNYRLVAVTLENTENVQDFGFAFFQCSALTSVAIDARSATSLQGAFLWCTELLSVSVGDTSNVTDMNNTFFNCTKLQALPTMDTSKVANFRGFAASCKALTEIPAYDMRAATSLYDAFNSCTGLTSIPELDLPNVNDVSYAFYGCTAVESGALAMYNRLKDLATMASYYAHQYTFTLCGSGTTSGAAELSQIPAGWK